MRIILYIGLPKTATTFFQEYLFSFLDESALIYNSLDLRRNLIIFIKNKIKIY